MEKKRREYGNTTRLGTLLDRIQAGDAAAREELIKESQERLRRLTSKMLGGFPGVRRAAAETDDVLFPVLLKLYQALNVVEFESGLHFVNLAAEKIRNQLIDLARKYRAEIQDRRNAGGNKEVGLPAIENVEDKRFGQDSHISLDKWAAFHQAVDQLPDDEKAVFKLRYYGAWKRQEVAALLGVDNKTVTRRFGRAEERLAGLINEFI